jgi:hypothetical protein
MFAGALLSRKVEWRPIHYEVHQHNVTTLHTFEIGELVVRYGTYTYTCCMYPYEINIRTPSSMQQRTDNLSNSPPGRNCSPSHLTW